MAQLLVRNLDDRLKARLQRRARMHGRSMGEEAREILRNALRDPEPSLCVGLCWRSSCWSWAVCSGPRYWESSTVRRFS